MQAKKDQLTAATSACFACGETVPSGFWVSSNMATSLTRRDSNKVFCNVFEDMMFPDYVNYTNVVIKMTAVAAQLYHQIIAGIPLMYIHC
jgi:hypothetical protein